MEMAKEINMEDALELIYARRSVRRYLDKPVPDELILRILEAGRWSPTAGDLNPWRMIVIRGENKDKLEEWGKVGRTIIQERYTWEKIAGDFEDYLLSRG